MDSRWRSALGRVFVWIAAEVILSVLGIDDLADYSEFVFDKNIPVLMVHDHEVQ